MTKRNEKDCKQEKIQKKKNISLIKTDQNYIMKKRDEKMKKNTKHYTIK